MRKHLMATCVLLLLLMVWMPVSGAKDGEAKRRTVVLVYDDSGSMRSSGKKAVNRWMYASYALQSFVGLLDGGDRFSYVLMSNPAQEIAVTLGKRQAEIDGIRNWNSYKNTPFQSVETAIEALKRQSSNGKDEFWLIMLTDGAFNELESSNGAQYEGNKKHITDTLRNFKAWMDERKLSVHSVLITMESQLTEDERQQVNTFKEIWQETINGILLPTDGEDGVVNSVNQAAGLIANRDPFSNVEDVVKTEVKGNKVTVTSPFPLRRITVVQQGSAENARVVKTSDATLVTEGPYKTQTPQRAILNGSITHLARSDGAVLKAGKYELQLDRDISSGSIKVLVEPALDYTVKVYKKEGKQLTEASEKMYEGSTVIVEAKPNELPVNSSYFAASIVQNGKSEPMKWDDLRKTFQYEMKVGTEPIRGNVSMNIKGFYQQTKEFRISPVPKPKLSLQVETKDWREKVTDLSESSPIVLQPLLDGKPMTAEEIKNTSFRVTFNKRISYELSQQGTKLYLYPRPYYSDTFNFTETGTIEAAITMESQEFGKASQVVVLTVADVSFWERYNVIFQYVLPIGIVIIMLAVLVIGWIIRPRFHRRAFISYELDQSLSDEWIHKGEPELLRNAWWKHYLGIPYRAERRTVQSVTFIAKKGTKAVFVAKESQVEGMIIDGSFLQEDEIGFEHRTLYPNEAVRIDRGYGKETYRYECD
ncbi:VWA domain-containing protein [Ectobacillus panaciterrae]|uniref:VWA domain-containing protein n=1 Tax=Ectobacillus panaciterrae TaxID=363872 RepID=UPI0003F5B3D3|nr:vWA domain-containing protein [Ectobacillus panaciterrae]